jgi:hypothetical protein
MRGLARLVAIVCAALAVPSSVAATAAPVLPPYFFQQGAGFEIHSNGAWHGVAGTVAVKEEGKYTNSTPRSSDDSYRIWAPTCTPGQKFSVARSVDLLGPPSSVSFSFAFTQYAASTAVLVNGKPAATSAGNNSPSDLKPPQLALFHEGMNELTVVVTMPSTKTACGAGALRSSVWFQISGYFAADLTVGAPKPGEQSVYFKADSGKTVTSNIRVINNGPDLIPEATVRIQMGGTGFCIKPKADGSCDPGDTQYTMIAGTEILGGGIRCTVDRFLIATCPVDNLKPGETRLVTAILRYRPDPAYPTWTEDDMPLSWNAQIAVGGPADSNSGNNAASVTYIFCSTRSTLAGCKTAQ